MRAYIVVTGVLFALITIAHILRAIDEGAHVATDPWFILLTLAAAALSFWSLLLLRRFKKS
jgi:hypothetical protein